MAKHPAPGRVKTRLAAAIGAEAACALYDAFVRDLAERLDALPYRVTWYFWPPDAPFAALLPHRRCRPQQGDDLGARMGAAIAAEHAEDGRPVIVLGADVPHVAAATLGEASAALRTGTDVVLGPADDGGYYLIGVRRPVAALFADVAWGSAAVLATTSERVRKLGLGLHLLPPTFDVDAPADLAALRAVIAGGAITLPRTAALLAAGGP